MIIYRNEKQKLDICLKIMVLLNGNFNLKNGCVNLNVVSMVTDNFPEV